MSGATTALTGTSTGGIRIVGATSNINSGVSINISKPAGVLPGDLLVAAMVNQDSVCLWSGDTGWTERVDQFQYPNLRIATKVAGGSEGASYTFSHDGSPTNELTGLIIALRRASYSNIGSIGTRSGAGTLTTTSITMASPGLLLAFAATANSAGTITSVDALLSVKTAGAGSYPKLNSYSQRVPSGATGNRTFTIGGTPDQVAGVLVGITRA